MGFVLDKQGDYLPVFGEASGGGSMANYLPHGTTFTVETDGSGDFTSIKAAVASLEYKWSDGTVAISVGEGTFTEEKILINSFRFNIPCLNIAGQGADKTIINSTTTDYAIEVNGNSKVFLSAFKVVPGGTKARTGIFCNSTVNVCTLNNITIENCATAISLDINTNCHAGTGITVKDCTDGIFAWRFSRITTNAGGSFVFNNVTTAWKVAGGGMIATSCPVGNITYTSVTTKCSQTVGTFNANGYIGGTLQN